MYALQALSADKTLKTGSFLNWRFSDWRPVRLFFNAQMKASNRQKTDALRFEISSEKMHILLSNRQICAADVHCLDASSKQCLQALCLKTCLLNTSHLSIKKEIRYD